VTAAPRLGELFHIGWVVHDCEAAQEELSARLGAGPFLSMGDELCFDQVLVHGKPVPVRLKIVFGVLGGVPIELLQPLDDRSPHAEFLATRGEGMHHLAFLVTDFDEQLAAARRANPELTLLIDGTGPGNEFRWVYLDGGNAREAVIELWERTPESEARYGAVRELLRQ
jgi:methylmalonyl-CoA/ethylmalonyl-CoA epimerase